MIETKDVAHPNLAVLSLECQELIKQGWEFVPEKYPVQDGLLFVATLARSPATVTNLLEGITAIANNAPPKLTRAEILAKARAARSCNKEKESEEKSEAEPEIDN